MGKVQAAADDPEAVARIGEKPAGSLSPFLWPAVIKRASNDPKPGGPMFAGLIPAGPRVGRVGATELLQRHRVIVSTSFGIGNAGIHGRTVSTELRRGSRIYPPWCGASGIIFPSPHSNTRIIKVTRGASCSAARGLASLRINYDGRATY